MRFFKNERGEFTVEATIVFTITFMVIIVLLYVGIVMYQHVHMQSATDRIASRGAMMYANRTTDMGSGARSLNSFWDSDPYRYIYDGSYRSAAERAIQNSLNAALGTENALTSSGQDQATAKVKLGWFSRHVEVTGSRKFNVPFISVFHLDNSMFDLNVKSTAHIMDMPETIRNVDYACDLLHQNQTANAAMNKIGELKGKLESFISKIQ